MQGCSSQRTSSMSRITISSSANAGTSNEAEAPAEGPFVHRAAGGQRSSSQCWARRTPSGLAYVRARRITDGSCTPVPSSVKSRTPRAAISAMGASNSPRRSWVIAPATATSRGVRAPRRARRRRARRCRGPARCWAWRPTRSSPPGRRPVRAALDRFGGFATGLAKVRVQVHEARSYPAVFGVDLVGVARRIDRRGDLGDPTVHDQARRRPTGVLDPRRRPCRMMIALTSVCPSVDPATLRYNTAMRIGTPLLTWRSMTAGSQVDDARIDLHAAVHRTGDA
jgi:hypothetical protein